MSKEQSDMELKACPFCGPRKDQHAVFENLVGPINQQEEWPECPLCEASMPVEVWNTRPTEDRLAAENKRLRGALENIASHLKTLSGSMVEYSVTYEIAREALEVKP